MKPMAKTKKFTLEKVLPWMLIVGGVIGLICSFIISLDKLRLLENPNFKPNCDLNPIVSCLSVMSSKQGSAFGFPNPWIGLAAFSVLITIGAAILAGAKFKRWFWVGLEVGCALGLIFAYWLLFESVFRIHALCPYCLTVDVVVITLFWYVSLFCIEQKFIVLPKKLTSAGNFSRRHHLDILFVWFLITIIIILKHFWYYYGKYL
jgi:uncharacterized membrane protein